MVVRTFSTQKGELTRAICTLKKYRPGSDDSIVVEDLSHARSNLVKLEQADALAFLKRGIYEPVLEDAKYLRRLARILEQR